MSNIVIYRPQEDSAAEAVHRPSPPFLILMGIGILIYLINPGLPLLGRAGIGMTVLGGTLLVMQYPYLGVAGIVALLPLERVFPGVPFFGTPTVALGVLTAVAFVLHIIADKKERRYIIYVEYVLVLGFLYHIFISNPEAAWLTPRNRNWFITYFQLTTLLIIASELMTPKRQKLVMILFLAATTLAALDAYTSFSGGLTPVNGEYLTSSVRRARSAGLDQNPNTQAFYYNVAFVFATYLYRQYKGLWRHPVFIGAQALLVLGVMSTVSRAGFLTMIVVVFMSYFGYPFLTAQRDDVTGRGRQLQTLFFSIIGMLFIAQFVVPATYWNYISESLINLDDSSLDASAAARLQLAESGINQWIDHPIFGIGIGQFAVLYRNTHNMYVTILAETGLIGFVLFFGLIISAFVSTFMTAIKAKSRDISMLAATWFIVVVVVLFRGPTASTLHYDKLMFAMLGIAVNLRRYVDYEGPIEDMEM
ncbi:MAG: O-antigen ligase family protein [Chloroflexi bacterium]|nr:O-antigen ligase family protein [Chloroflexota bacterium]